MAGKRRSKSSKRKSKVVELKSDFGLDIPTEGSKVRNTTLSPKKNNPFLGDF